MKESGSRSTSDMATMDVNIIYLQMTEPPTGLLPDPPRRDLLVMRAEQPSVSYYRYLYDHVGSPWLWYERRLLGDDALATIVRDPAVEVHVLYVAGVPAGYAELDRRVAGEAELAYFGLLPDFIGQGLGAHLLGWAIRRGWRGGPRRLWVHTCSLDHPRALDTYLASGFKEYRRESKRIPDPRLLMGGTERRSGQPAGP
jgi:GNAT superfamily N-acetyltransferase